MALVEYTLEGKEDKVETAINRLKAFEPPEGYFLAFSGGKDSVVIKRLAEMAGVKFDAHYSVTSVDPPELVRFVKEQKDVSFDIPRDKDGNAITMWNLIPKKRMPPTRLVRYCCEKLKECAGKGRLTVTGIRWAESTNRKTNGGLVRTEGNSKTIKSAAEIGAKIAKNGGVILNFDNDDARRFVEHCYRTSKTTLNPIIDWDDSDVWEFIKSENIPYCGLYDCGYKRLGCVGCPMNNNRAEELERYPKIKDSYLRAFNRMLAEREAAGLETQWNTPEEVMAWWLRG
jgi:phosphoadenosine phosphosulfate reductase